MNRSPFPIAPPARAFPDDWPAFGLGCAPLGDLFHDLPEAEAAATLSAAWQAGVRYYDTAPWYGHGLSEHRLGALIRQHPRAEAVISTKVGRVYSAAPRGQDTRVQWQGGLNFNLRYDYSAEGFGQSLAQSRMRLGQSSLDALIIHDLDRAYHGAAFDRHIHDLTGTGLAALQALRAAGEISAVGMGINALPDFTEFAEWLEVDFFLVAMPYTLLDQAALHGPMARCLARGIKVIIGAPFASGLLTNPSNPNLLYNYAPASPEIRQKAQGIEAICARHDVPLMAAALQFPRLHPAVVSVIPGAVSPSQATQNLINSQIAIPVELWADLKAAGLIDPDAPT